mmetsp:Transcript_19918/g.41416  ORF Transcript_19918/g.41416 Transcript_19918/m.41416 type:complete len:246 (+) Transcript_19918:662-1399(+)
MLLFLPFGTTPTSTHVTSAPSLFSVLRLRLMLSSSSKYATSPASPAYATSTWLPLQEAAPTFLRPGHCQSLKVWPSDFTWRMPLGWTWTMPPSASLEHEMVGASVTILESETSSTLSPTLRTRVASAKLTTMYLSSSSPSDPLTVKRPLGVPGRSVTASWLIPAPCLITLRALLGPRPHRAYICGLDSPPANSPTMRPVVAHELLRVSITRMFWRTARGRKVGGSLVASVDSTLPGRPMMLCSSW